MDASCTRLIEGILRPRPMGSAAPDASPATAFTIRQIIAPRGPVLRVDPAALVAAAAPVPSGA